ncbi:MAG TPA: TonB-dependent receptor [Terriglobales bacterium]|nr:TonB-dependent receptor [Terriglobales bacterium]
MQRSIWFICKSSTSSFLVLLMVALTTVPAMFGQAYSGTVSGELTDATSAVVTGAKVILTDQEKGFNFQTTSDSSGGYLFRSIPPGVYVVSVEAAGFAKTESAKFKVDVNENATANLTLKVAGATQTVEVGAQAQAIQTEDAETGQVVNRRFINDLPLLDRNIESLTALAPGVTEMNDSCPEPCIGTNFVSNGSRGATSDILLDGASATNSEPNGGITSVTYLPSPEAVEEFKVQQTNFSAEYGFSGASVVNVVSRSGTNKFHGSVYEFLRDDSLDANDWFANRNGDPIPPLRRHNYGGTIGGPIFKNKTFFFFDYDGLTRTGLSTATGAVPSDAMRTGDFGELCAAQGGTFDGAGRCGADAGQIWDPYSGTFNGTITRSTFIPFNNIATYASPGGPNPNVAGNLIDPVAQKMMTYFPEPNINGGSIYQNWFGSGSSHSSNKQFDIKIDHRFTENNLMSAKFAYQYSPSGTGLDCFKNFTDPCQGGPGWTNAHAFAINDTHTFSPTLLLTTTLGFTRGVWHIDAYNPRGENDPLGTLGFPSYLEANGFKGVPAIFIDQYTPAGYANIGTDPYGNYRLGQDTGQLSATIDNVHGRHDIKFGFDGRIHQINYIQTNAAVGFFSFNTDATNACPDGLDLCGGDSMASFMMGQMTQGCASNGCGSYEEIQFRPATTNYQYGFFAQDNWKVTPKLTLNLGLRYDVTLPRTDRFNHQDWFDTNATSPLNGGSVTYTDPVTGQPVNLALKGGEVFASSKQRTNYVTDWSNFQPRFGFAYQVVPNTVLRGGYGIYYGQSRSGVTGVVPYGSAGFNQFTNVITVNPNDLATPFVNLNNPFKFGLIQPAGNSLGLLNDVGFGANGPIRTPSWNQTPYEQSWSFGIEHELPSHILINAEYIGKKGTHLPFSGSTERNFLGPWVENLPVGDFTAATPCQAGLSIACLSSAVTNPFAGLISDPNSTIGSSFPQIQYYQLLRPFPHFTGVSTEPQMIANSIYHGLQLTAEKKYSNGLQLLATFTWSKSIDNASAADTNVSWAGSFDSLQDPNKPELERSLSSFDIPYVIQFSYSYDLPVGHGRAFLGNLPRWADLIIGGWKTNGIWRISDGRPLAFFLDDGGQPLPTYGSQRPDIVGTPKRNHGSDWVDNYFADNNVFQRPAPFTLGDARRTLGSVRSPWSFTTNLSVGKQFLIREEMNFEFRVEAKNAFNHPVFGTPDTNVGDDTFGTISYTSVGPREIQLGFKFNF